MISHNNTISKQIFKKWFDNVNNIRYWFFIFII
jgi:hypothetical protein